MSGWIKFEKDIATDPRFLRMVRLFRANDVTQQRFTERAAVTHLLGGLLQLWMYADTHIREDDTLDLGPDEIDEVIGIQGFAALMPSDWLEVIDAHSVKLPGFQDHNGTDAKKKALTQKRVARHRIRTVTQPRNNTTTTCNAGALPDQTRPDQTKTRPEEKIELSAAPTDVSRGTSDAGQIAARVFAHWRETWDHPRAKFDAKRRQKIRDALQLGYSEADLCQCISGYRNSPHHMGQNDRNTVFDDVELFLRDAKHIDAGMTFYTAPPSNLSVKTLKIVDQTAGWVPPEMRRAAN